MELLCCFDELGGIFTQGVNNYGQLGAGDIVDRGQLTQVCICVCLRPTPAGDLQAARGVAIPYHVDSARVVKEKVLHRLKSFNVTQLVDFVVTKMEAHYIRHLTHVANNRL
ncbi:F-box only protein 24 [Merluccius polli]|uniref:F-box only protein 24 n=1 Tax=Merluccius polli TaxID=89951 RepID=A0AA47NUV7_MERPO|nr:F-box only protein 24 [Merluccius polli]